jgi:hypothetical protein
MIESGDGSMLNGRTCFNRAVTLTVFLRQFGLVEDPFESTNADAEPRLSAYFVPPPYFASVLGDSRSPKSHVVLAPRGGGKTAQRRMIENRSFDAGDFLCITYDRFDQPPGFALKDATLPYHLNQVCRLILVGVLVQVESDTTLVERLTDLQKQLLKFQIDRFLGSMSAAEFAAAGNSLKNFGDKARDFFNKYGGPLRVVLNAIMSRVGLDKVDLPEGFAEEARRDESLQYHFAELLKIVKAIGFNSTYVLVDRVDELSLTGDAPSTFAFMRSLLADLPTLETPGVGFKFFLWDQIRSAYAAEGSRPDRIPVDTLQWSVDELAEMLSERLAAYSEGNLASFNQMLCPDVPLNVHRLVAYLAGGSPRDMIRLCKRIISEQTRTSERDRCVDEAAVWTGVRAFSEERAYELYGAYLSDMKKIGDATFTIKELVNEVFRVGENAVRRKVQIWQENGLVAKIGELPNPPNRPTYLFGVQDPRLLITMSPSRSPLAVLHRCVVQCPRCSNLCISERVRPDCPRCANEFDAENVPSLIDLIRTP